MIIFRFECCVIGKIEIFFNKYPKYAVFSDIENLDVLIWGSLIACLPASDFFAFVCGFGQEYVKFAKKLGLSIPLRSQFVQLSSMAESWSLVSPLWKKEANQTIPIQEIPTTSTKAARFNAMPITAMSK